MAMASAHLARLQAKLSNQWIRSKFAQAQNRVAECRARVPAVTSAERTRAVKQYFGALLISLGMLLSAYVGGTYAWMYHEQRSLLHQWRSEERRVGKGVDLGGRRIMKKKKKRGTWKRKEMIKNMDVRLKRIARSNGDS